MAFFLTKLFIPLHVHKFRPGSHSLLAWKGLMLDTGANNFKRDEGRKEEKIMNTVKEVSLPPVIKARPQLFPSIASKIESP